MELTKLSVAPRVMIVTLSFWDLALPVSSTPTPQRERGAPVIKPKLRQVMEILLRSAAAVCRSQQTLGYFIIFALVCDSQLLDQFILALLNTLLVIS